MSDFADAFDAELRSPTLMLKTAISTGGLINTFKSTTREAGPALALMSSAPDIVGAYGAHKGLREAAKEDPAAPGVDEQGNATSPAEHRKQLKKKKKELAGEVGSGIGSVIGNVASWMIPMGPEFNVLSHLVAPAAVGMGGGWAGRQVGRMLG